MRAWEELITEWIKNEFSHGYKFVLRSGSFYFNNREIEAGKNVKVKVKVRVEGYVVIIACCLDDKDLLDPNYDPQEILNEIRAEVEKVGWF